MSTDAFTPNPLPGDTLNAEETYYVSLLNAYRAARGLSTLTTDALLTKVANRHVIDISENVGYQTHDWSIGTFSAGAQRFGVTGAFGENAYIHPNAIFSVDADRAHQAWIDSSGHRANMERADWTTVGVAWGAHGAMVVFGTAFTGHAHQEVPGTTPHYEIVSNGQPAVWFGGVRMNDTMRGHSGYDRLLGQGGDDTLIGGQGDDVLDGGTGRDTAVVGATRAQSTVTLGTAVTVSGPDGTDLLSNVERIRFADGTLAIDTGDVAAQAFRLYRAGLGRAPEPSGLGFHTRALEGGWSLPDVARNFTGSDEFRTKYGPLDDMAFIQQLYQNVLGRPGEANGVAYHLNDMGQGKSREAVLASFSESPENVALTAPLINDGLWYT